MEKDFTTGKNIIMDPKSVKKIYNSCSRILKHKKFSSYFCLFKNFVRKICYGRQISFYIYNLICIYIFYTLESNYAFNTNSIFTIRRRFFSLWNSNGLLCFICYTFLNKVEKKIYNNSLNKATDLSVICDFFQFQRVW